MYIIMLMYIIILVQTISCSAFAAVIMYTTAYSYSRKISHTKILICYKYIIKYIIKFCMRYTFKNRLSGHKHVLEIQMQYIIHIQ